MLDSKVNGVEFDAVSDENKISESDRKFRLSEINLVKLIGFLVLLEFALMMCDLYAKHQDFNETIGFLALGVTMLGIISALDHFVYQNFFKEG